MPGSPRPPERLVPTAYEDRLNQTLEPIRAVCGKIDQSQPPSQDDRLIKATNKVWTDHNGEHYDDQNRYQRGRCFERHGRPILAKVQEYGCDERDL